MIFVVEFFLILTVGIAPFILGSLLHSKYSELHLKLSNPERLIGQWVAGTAPIAAVLYIALSQPEGMASLGLSGGIFGRNNTAIGVGIGWISLLIILVYVIELIRRKGKPREQKPPDLTKPVIKEIARYTRFWERAAYLLDLVFIVVGEDLVSRGYLVLFMGSRTHTYIPWILLSIGFSIIVHLYQGRNWKTVLYHAVFAAFFIALALSTRNLLTAISAHLFYDVLWTIGNWRLIDKWYPHRVKPGIQSSESSTAGFQDGPIEDPATSNKRNRTWLIVSLSGAALIICLAVSYTVLSAVIPALVNILRPTP